MRAAQMCVCHPVCMLGVHVDMCVIVCCGVWPDEVCITGFEPSY